jgi:hypothetical protein
MAQADSVPSSSRQLITGESANQSTNLRALNPPAVRVEPSDRRYFIGGSDVPVITDTDEALVFWIWRKRRGDVGLEDLSNCRWYAASTCQRPKGSNIRALSFESACFLRGGCSGPFLSCFGSGTGISTYASARSTGCHQTGWSHRSNRGG